jgi:hypothetical protein
MLTQWERNYCSDMLRALLSLTLLLATPALAQPENAERRADGLRTIELNERAHAIVHERDRSNADVREQNRKAMERYERQRAEWRKRVADCRAGDWDACKR